MGQSDLIDSSRSDGTLSEKNPVEDCNLNQIDDTLKSKKFYSEKYSDIWGRLAHVSTIITALFTSIGAVVGFFAYLEYHKSNLISLNSQLYTQDREYYKKIDTKPHVLAVFAVRPKDIDVMSGANKMLLICAGSNRLSFKWKDVPDLYEKLYQVDGFNIKDRIRLRDALDMAENILYLVYNVYDAVHTSKKDFIIGNLFFAKDYDIIGSETWYAYLNELGENPLFLAAIYKAHKYGYLDQDFAAFIQKRFRGSGRIKEVLKVIYPELVKDDKWPSKVGGRYKTVNE